MEFNASNTVLWNIVIQLGIIAVTVLFSTLLRRKIAFVRQAMLPTAVLAGFVLLILRSVGLLELDGDFLEMTTYHGIAVGFIAMSLRVPAGNREKGGGLDGVKSGALIVSTYLVQALLGLLISAGLAFTVMPGLFKAAGILLPFGYGQGTGQALNYGGIFENDFGFVGGKSFGLTIAALGFLSASIGGVIHLNIQKRRGKIKLMKVEEKALRSEQIQSDDEIPMQESIDKLTIQIALIALAYLLAYLLMDVLGLLLPSMKSVIYGFNFLLGVLTATLVKLLMGWLKKKRIIKKEYTNAFLMTRASNFFFDIMVVAGIAAIRFSVLKDYWGIILIMGVVGLVITYVYNYFVAKKLFPEYVEEQFLTMYGMLTGTASTGVILLREIDGEFKTPALDNLVYQNFPAIVFGFPMMLLATLAPVKPLLTLLILILFFIVMNVILFRSYIFRRKK